MSVNSDMVHTEQATTRNNILSAGLPASWQFYVIKISAKFNLRVPNF